MSTLTTMVLFILVETTSPTLVARPVVFAVVSAMAYFFSDFLAADFLAGAFALAFVLTEAFAFAAGAAFTAAAFAGFAVAVGTSPNWRSRAIVFKRATPRRNERILFKLSVCPIFIWNFRRKSWSIESRSFCFSSASVKLRTFSAFIIIHSCAAASAGHS